MGCGDLARAPQPVDGRVSTEPTVETDPPPIEGMIAPIVRFRVAGLPKDSVPSLLVLEGVASDRNVRDLQQGTVSETLQKRVVDTTQWSTEPGCWEIATKQPLGLGQSYSIVESELGWVAKVDVMDRDPTPTLQRVWPPAGRGGMRAVWCSSWPATGEVASLPQRVRMAPGVDGTMDVGAMAGMGANCVHWVADAVADVGGRVVVPPPRVQIETGSWVRLDPIPIVLGEKEESWGGTCSAGQQQAGPACALVLDDRAVLSASEPWLVGLDLAGEVRVGAIGPDAAWVVRSLPPSSEVRGRVRVVSVSGGLADFDIVWRTTDPQARVVINEVMANPVGPEPQQEWVELYNDGAVAVGLGGWRFEDAGGGVDLPDVTLQPGEYGLLVGEGYDASSWVDAIPAEGTVLIGVSSVGTGGLSNAGEPLRLVGADGSAVSSVPPRASKHPGGSIVRVRPEAPDGEGSFGVDLQGGTPGAANRLE
jgi:hypothetical protein